MRSCSCTHLRTQLHEAERRAAEAERRVAEAERLSLTDHLTGFSNTRYLARRLAEELERARRHGHELALMLIDSDALKLVNDRLGHEAGDRYLVLLARTILAQVRASDVVARYGGDEFVVLAPLTGRSAALLTAERIRASAAALVIDGLATSVSVGVAVYPCDAGAGDALLRAADRALYEAKRRGKNAVVAAPASQPSKMRCGSSASTSSA